MNRFITQWLVGAWLIGLPLASLAQEREPDNREVKWLRSASEAARLADETGKPILVYVRSENCHYCDLLQKKTWQDPETKKMIMRDMIPLKLTLEDNKQAIEAMKVKGFPSTILFTPQREFLLRVDGFVSPEDFQKQIAKIRLVKHNPALLR